RLRTRSREHFPQRPPGPHPRRFGRTEERSGGRRRRSGRKPLMPDPADLTLEQKASLLSGKDFSATKSIAGVPPIIMFDGPHGLRLQDTEADHLGINDSLPATCFPTAAAVGSSWDPDVAAELGAAIGREARIAGVTVNLGP